ncbi:hypothetical protein [Dyella sp. RRB7]|uniref:hypothetical protein n=1 Tax=Dyella sp. RRB7 TaxID=2919502 RepID=UPI001FAA0D64|nr:hypothetical protein [Dyella sp. RRB7]
MELDDFKLAWQQIDRRLEQQHALNLQWLQTTAATRARRRLRPLWFGQLLQMAGGVALIVLAAGFWSARRDNPHLLACGLMLHGYGLMLVLAGARNLYLIGRVDYGLPVLVIQKRLAALRAWRVGVEAPVFGALGCFVWIPLALVSFDHWWGVDLWVRAPVVVWSFIASGVACLLVFGGIIAWSRRPGHERMANVLSRQAAGGSVQRAQAELQELARFEQD